MGCGSSKTVLKNASSQAQPYPISSFPVTESAGDGDPVGVTSDEQSSDSESEENRLSPIKEYYYARREMRLLPEVSVPFFARASDSQGEVFTRTNTRVDESLSPPRLMRCQSAPLNPSGFRSEYPPSFSTLTNMKLLSKDEVNNCRLFLENNRFDDAIYLLKGLFENSYVCTNELTLSDILVECLLWRGLSALVDEDTSTAVNFFSESLHYLDTLTKSNNAVDRKKLMVSEILKSLISVNESEKMETVQEAVHHRIKCMIYCNVEFLTGLTSVPIKSARLSETKLDKLIERLETLFLALSSWVNLQTRGGFKLSFEVEIVSEAKLSLGIRGSTNASIFFFQPDWKSSSSEISQEILTDAKCVETFVIGWMGSMESNIELISSIRGSFHCPTLGKRPSISLKRGFMSLNLHDLSACDFLSVLSQFSSVFESLSNIQPSFGFQNSRRHYFPYWKGQGLMSFLSSNLHHVFNEFSTVDKSLLSFCTQNNLDETPGLRLQKKLNLSLTTDYENRPSLLISHSDPDAIIVKESLWWSPVDNCSSLNGVLLIIPSGSEKTISRFSNWRWKQLCKDLNWAFLIFLDHARSDRSICRTVEILKEHVQSLMPEYSGSFWVISEGDHSLVIIQKLVQSCNFAISGIVSLGNVESDLLMGHDFASMSLDFVDRLNAEFMFECKEKALYLELPKFITQLPVLIDSICMTWLLDYSQRQLSDYDAKFPADWMEASSAGLIFRSLFRFPWINSTFFLSLADVTDSGKFISFSVDFSKNSNSPFVRDESKKAGKSRIQQRRNSWSTAALHQDLQHGIVSAQPLSSCLQLPESFFLCLICSRVNDLTPLGIWEVRKSAIEVFKLPVQIFVANLKWKFACFNIILLDTQGYVAASKGKTPDVELGCEKMSVTGTSHMRAIEVDSHLSKRIKESVPSMYSNTLDIFL